MENTKDVEVHRLPKNVINIECTSAVLPSGTYFIGDNGYLASENGKAWDAWVSIADEMSDGFSKPISGACYNEYYVVGSNTAYGDGTYSDNHGNKYSVDSGMIGATPIGLLEEMGVSLEKFKNLGHFYKFKNTVTLTYLKGTISFKSEDLEILIPTGS